MLKVLGSLTLRQWLFSWVHADISLLLTLVPRIRLCIGWGKVIQHSVVTEGQSHGANEWEMGFKLISSAPTLKHCLRARCLCNGILRLMLFSSPSQNTCTYMFVWLDARTDKLTDLMPREPVLPLPFLLKPWVALVTLSWVSVLGSPSGLPPSLFLPSLL